MANNKEVIAAAALIIMYYLFRTGKAEAAEGLPSVGLEKGITGEGAAYFPGTNIPIENYVEDKSHILIRYPGLKIFTPLERITGATYTDQAVAKELGISLEDYIDIVRGEKPTKEKTIATLQNLDASGEIYIGAPIMSSSDFSRVQILNPIRIIAPDLAQRGPTDIERILEESQLPARLSGFEYLSGRVGPGSTYYALFKVTIDYPEGTPQVLDAVRDILTTQYAYSYEYLRSFFGDI